MQTIYIYTLSLHDALPISLQAHDMVLLQLELDRVLDRHDPLVGRDERRQDVEQSRLPGAGAARDDDVEAGLDARVQDRKSTRLNSSHMSISYAVFCLKKKK